MLSLLRCDRGLTDIQSCNTSFDSSLYVNNINITEIAKEDQDQCYVYDCLQNGMMHLYVNRSYLSHVSCQSWNFSRTRYENTIISEVMYSYITVTVAYISA